MIPYIKGTVTNQAHVDIPKHLHEEEFGRSGFFGRYAHMYREHAPVGWTNIEGDLAPRCYNLNDSAKPSDDYLENRVECLRNSDVSIQYAKIDKAMPYYFRNADADEVMFVHKGNGRLETDFGPLNYVKGDYLVIPRGTVYRLDPKAASELLIVESFSEITLPDKGMLGQHALFDPAMITVPSPEEQSADVKERESLLRIKRCGRMTNVTYPFCPIDTVGWKGTLTVWQLNIKDIRPISSERYHLPPSAHSTFLGQNFVICTFLPRPLEVGDPGALKVPYYHSNIDYDEVLFYHDGEFFSRTNIEPGMMTFHPQGIHHGPQKDAIERSKDAERTQEVAIMIDTKFPLEPVASMKEIENQDYWKSWR